MDEDDKTNAGATASGILNQMNNFKFVFYANLLHQIFETTNILNLELQSEQMDVVSAFKLSEITVAHLDKLRENDFESIFKDSMDICEKDEFLINTNASRRSTAIDSKHPNFKQQYSDKFKLIIDVFVNEIIARFEPTSYITLIELYECFINFDYNREIDVQKLNIYKNILDFERLKCDAKAFVCYKVKNNEVDWHNFNELIAHYKFNNLKKFFPQIHQALKLYLSIPATTTTAERSFSCLKLLKTWLRSTSTNERLSDLGIIKMNNHKNSGFSINVNKIIDDFVNIPTGGRRLLLR